MFAEFETLLKVALTIMNSWELVMPSAGRDVSLKVNTIVVGPLTRASAVPFAAPQSRDRKRGPPLSETPNIRVTEEGEPKLVAVYERAETSAPRASFKKNFPRAEPGKTLKGARPRLLWKRGGQTHSAQCME